jgi:hypothetical protein
MTNGPYYHITIPVAGTNAHANPSAEVNATGWAGTAGGTATRQAGTAAFGAWAMAGTVGAAQGTGITYGTPSLSAGSYTVSAYVYGGSGSVYSIGIKGTGAGAAFVGSVAGTTGGTWHRYSFSYGEAAPINRLFAVVKRSAGADPFIVDGVQIEGGTFLTTYIDGDQDGCVWLGQAGASASSRSGTSRQGGTVVSLQSLGLTVLEAGDVGMPPVSNITQEYAIADGAQWQRQRATSRVFTLTSLFSGTTWPGLHAIRQRVIDALKIDRTPNPQPFRLLYTGAGGTTTIDAYYDGGLTMDSRAGFSETTAVRLLAPDPYWYGVRDEGTALLSQSNLGSTNLAAYRDPLGRWGTMGASGSALVGTVNGQILVSAITALPTGTVLFGGDFITAGGTPTPGIAAWHPNTGRWGTLAGGTLARGGALVTVYDITVSPQGTVYVGGQFGTVGGTTTANVAFHAGGAWGTLTNGTVNNIVYALGYSPAGTLFTGGALTTAGGTQARYIAQHANGSWGTLSGGTLDSEVYAIVAGGQRTYVGGAFSLAGGSAADAIATYSNGSWGTMSTGVANGVVETITVLPSGAIVAGGGFTNIASGSALRMAQWNGNQWSALGAGLNQFVYSATATASGMVYAAGYFGTAGGVAVTNGLAQWNGAAWLPLDIAIPGTALPFVFRANAITVDPGGTLYIGGNFAGTALAAGVTAVVNSGASNAYPVVTLTNTSATPQRLYQILNTATNDNIWFDLTIAANETLTVDLRNGRKTVTSNARGNLITTVMPGSNLTTWRLAPGTNYVSIFAASGSVEASLYWRPRGWSNDMRV